MDRHFKLNRGFSLLEVVLASGILGGVLAGLLSFMVDSGRNSEELAQRAILLNTQRSVQNILTRERKALSADTMYCGYKDNKFQFNADRANLDTVTAVLVKDQESESLGGKVNLVSYQLGIMNQSTGGISAHTPHLEVVQSITKTSYENFSPNDPKLAEIYMPKAAHVTQITSISESYTKYCAAWTYSSVTAWENSNRGYASAQMFEYVSESTYNYGSITTWNDSTKQSFGNRLLSELNSSDNDRQTNWSSLKNDSVLGSSATTAFEAHYALGNAMANGSVSLSEAQNKISAAIDSIYATISSNSQYLKDFNNNVKAYKSAYEAAQQNGQRGQNDTFKAVLNENGTDPTSYGSQLAAIMMSLGSSQNILDSYLSSQK